MVFKKSYRNFSPNIHKQNTLERNSSKIIQRKKLHNISIAPYCYRQKLM